MLNDSLTFPFDICLFLLILCDTSIVAPRILAFLMNQALIETTHSSAMALTPLIAPCHIVLVLRYPTHPAGLMYYYIIITSDC